MPDLSGSVDMGEDEDLSGADFAGGSPDLLQGPDLDDHNPLKLVGNAVPLKQDGGVDYYELHVKEGQVQVLPGPKTTIWGFDGEWPGKTIHATLGRPVTVRVFNELPVQENLSIHNHGHNVQSAFDGHPSENLISPPPAVTNFYDYKYPNLQQGGVDPNFHGAATYFFHDHVVDLTAPHFYKGIEAFYIIHPKAGSTEAALNLPSGDYDIPLMIQDRSFNADNSLKWVKNIITGFQGDKLVVNGTVKPSLDVARRKYRFRLLNGSNTRRINIGLSSGTLYQIGTDGGLLKTLQSPTRIPMAPAERVDIVIDFAKYKIGDVVTIINDDTFAPPIPEVIQFRVVRDEVDNSSLPLNLDPGFVKYDANTPAGPSPSPNPMCGSTRCVSFDYDNGVGRWFINGQLYNADAVEFPDVKIGNVETWSLINADTAHPIPHPFHQHLVEFQVLDICPVNNPTCGTPPPISQQGWKDTILVPSNTIVRIKMKFYYSAADPFNAGNYVFHCHNLEHEDDAMMLQQTISP